MTTRTHNAELSRALTFAELMTENARLARNLRMAQEDNRRLREGMTKRQREKAYMRELR